MGKRYYGKNSNHESGTMMIVIIVVVVVAFLVLGGCAETFTFNNSQYQYGNPNLKREYNYYKCLQDECGGDTHNYGCLEKCHLKTYRRGMKAPDIKDLVCQSYSGDTDAYYRCLDAVYTDYKYP
jgi:hypothetical protein